MARSPQSSRQAPCSEAERVRKKWPNSVPVTIHWSSASKEIKKRMMVPKTMSVRSLRENATSQGGVPPDVVEKLLIDGCGEPVAVFDGQFNAWTVGQLDDSYRDAAGFLSLRLPKSSSARGSEDTRQEEASKKEEEKKKEETVAVAEPSQATDTPQLQDRSTSSTLNPEPEAKASALESRRGSSMTSEETQVFTMDSIEEDEDDAGSREDLDWDAWNEEAASGARSQSYEAKQVIEVHPDRVPVHCQEANTVPPEVQKLLAQATLQVQEFEKKVYEIFRGTAPDPASNPTRLYVGNMHLSQPDQLMKDVFNLYQSRTGLLHVTVHFETEEEENGRLEASLRQAQACLSECFIERDQLSKQVEKEKRARDAAEQKALAAQSECISVELALQQLASAAQEKDELIKALQAQLQAFGQVPNGAEGEK